MERQWVLLSLFFLPSCSKSSPTPGISYWTWPSGQVAIPHLQQAGGGWAAPLAAHAGNSAPLLAPGASHRATRAALASLWRLSLSFLSVCGTYTHTQQLPVASGAWDPLFFELSSPAHHWLHCSLLPAIGSDLFLGVFECPAVEHAGSCPVC